MTVKWAVKSRLSGIVVTAGPYQSEVRLDGDKRALIYPNTELIGSQPRMVNKRRK